MQLPPELSQYWEFRDELSVYDGIVFRGSRPLIPKTLRKEVLDILHQAHMGLVSTKQRARDIIFWPGMNLDIEEMITKCDICLQHRNRAPKEPMKIHPIPTRPWSRVGCDIFQFQGRQFLILVDYYSNFIEVEKLDSLNSKTVIRILKANAARYGLMDVLITDNGPQFCCEEFRKWCKIYNIEHVTSSPLHPQSNGMAERAVQTIKTLMRKCVAAGEDFYLALLDLRNTPRDSLIGSPAQRLMGRRTKTKLPTSEALLRPSTIRPEHVTNSLLQYRLQQKDYYDRGARPLPPIKEQQAVRIRTPNGWQPAEFVRHHEAPRSHTVRAGSQRRLYRRIGRILW